MMNFGTFPPELNSGLMYSGPGAAPLLAAGAAWQQLAGELNTAAGSYTSALDALTTDSWQGPAATAMAAAATPYVVWMNTTAAQAEQAADAAQLASDAYHAAFAMTVPPPMIAANRALMTSLVATNFLGQNTPAIAATEAQYAEMWAQDAAAMYGYAGESATAVKLTPFGAPPSSTSPTGSAAQATAVAQAAGTSAAGNTQTTLSQVVSSVPTTLQSLASPMGSSTSPTSGLNGILSSLGLTGSTPSALPSSGTSTGILSALTGSSAGIGGTMASTAAASGASPNASASTTSLGSMPSGLMNVLDTLTGNGSGTGFSALFNDLFSSSGLGLNDNLWNTIFSSGFYMPGNFLGTMMDFMGLADITQAEDVVGAAAGTEGLGGALGLGGIGGLGSGLGGVVSSVGGSAAVSASLGQAVGLGGLSAPQAFAPAAGAMGPAAGLLGGAPLGAPPGVAAGMPMSPLSAMAGMAGQGMNGGALPRYGFKPTVISRSPIG